MAKKPTPKEIRERYNAADKKWNEWRSLYELCYRYAAPQRNLFNGEQVNQGESKMNLVFDSTAISSLDRFANRVQSNVFPPQKKWARLEPGSRIPPDMKQEVLSALERVNDEMFAVMRSSNFDIAIGEFLHDIGIGTAHMCIQPGDYSSPVNYTAVSPAVVRFEEDEYGRPCNHYRPMKVKGELITKIWKRASISGDLKRKIDEKPQDEIDLLESTVRDLETGKYHYQVITNHQGTKNDDAEEIFHRSQKYSNWVTSRYSKLAGEILGRGPVVSALPDIRTLNKVKELLLRGSAKNIKGIYTAVDDGVLNTNNLEVNPGTIIGVAANAGPRGPSLMPLPASGDANLAQIIINDLVVSIKRIMLDESLPPDTASARSATEIIERMKELAQNMGSAHGRLVDEVLIPIIEITLEVLKERGVIDIGSLRVDGREIKAVPVAPLAMAQNLDEVETIINFANMTALLGGEGVVALNKSRTIDYVGNLLGVAAQIRNTPEERQAEMEAQQQQAQQAAIAQTAMAAAEKAAPAMAKQQPQLQAVS